MWRQGDVLIQAIAEIPDGVSAKSDLILAEGEATGHMHRIADGKTAELFEKGAEMFLRVFTPNATVVHDEHGPIALKPGNYRVWLQREYAPEVLRIKTRPVRD